MADSNIQNSNEKVASVKHTILADPGGKPSTTSRQSKTSQLKSPKPESSVKQEKLQSAPEAEAEGSQQASRWKRQSTLAKKKTLRQQKLQQQAESQKAQSKTAEIQKAEDHQEKSKQKRSNKRVLLTYENKVSWMAQFWDMTAKHFRNLLGFSLCPIAAMIAVPLFACASFFYVKSVAKTQTYPDFDLTKLKHPVYQTTYLDPVTDTFDSNYGTNYRQQEEFEEFFQFMNYTNTERETGKDENGEPIMVRSYQPSVDLTGPGSWLPTQCYSSVDYKYASTVIAYIKNGNKLEQDLLKQIQNIFDDQEYIYEFDQLLQEFLDKIDLGALSGGGDATEEEIFVEEEVVEEEPEAAVDPNVFVIDPLLLDAAGGAPPDPHAVNVETMGNFTYVEFESVESIFEYVQSEGYGWDPEIPGICFGFQVTENEEKNKYELEWLYRDQWPYMYTTMLRNDKDPAPISNANQLLGYTRAAYNGLNMLQVFTANSIMQRKFTTDAHIILFTVPYKIMEMRTSPLAVAVLAFNSIFFVLTIVPLMVYMSYSIAQEKETGIRHLLHSNGLGQAIHYLSWLAHYMMINFLISLLYSLTMKMVVFKNDSIILYFLVTFIGIQSIFGLIWAVQPCVKSAKMGIFLTSLLFFLSFFGSYVVNQKEPSFDKETKQMWSIAPMTAIKLTLDTYANFYNIEWGMNFDNYDVVMDGWSLKIGLQMFVFNFLLWSALGLFFDLVFSNMSHYYSNCLCFWRNAGSAGMPWQQRKVKFEKMRDEDSLSKSEDIQVANNKEQGVIQITGLQERSIFSCRGQKQFTTSYNFSVEKSKICCLIGNDSAQKTKILEMLAGNVNCHGNIVIKDNDFFIQVTRSSTLVLDSELTATQHLNLFAHLRGNEKHRNTRIMCDKLLPEKTKVRNYSESQRQLLQTLIALASDNSRIILLDEPSMGLDPQQRSELIKALWQFKKDRYIIMQSSDVELVNVLADTVAKVLSSGIEIVKASDGDQRFGSYRLIVKVKNSKPSDNLVRYLSKDVPDLTLEYHTEQFTNYILPEINKTILYMKTKFMEKNKTMLGLIDFEVVSMTAFEVAQRQILLEESLQMSSCDVADFSDSIQDQSYGQEEEAEESSINEPNRPNQNTNRQLFESDKQPSSTRGLIKALDQLQSYREDEIEQQQNGSQEEKKEELITAQQHVDEPQFVNERSPTPTTPYGKSEHRIKLPDIHQRSGEMDVNLSYDTNLQQPKRVLSEIEVFQNNNRTGTAGTIDNRQKMLITPQDVVASDAQGVYQLDKVNNETQQLEGQDNLMRNDDKSFDGNINESERDPEMKEFLQLMSQPLEKPNYNSEFLYDFQKNKAKRSSCCTQCLFIWLRHWKESWNQKIQFLALLTLPALSIFIMWHSARYYHHENVESRLIQPDWYPQKNKILVNERTQVGGIDTKKWVENLPQRSYFEPTFVNTDEDKDYFDFNQDVFDYCMVNATDYPWSYGSYQLFEMNEEKHQYKFGSFVNVTSPYATQLYPQYMIESIMKTASQDEDFEFKTRMTAFPVTHDTINTGSFLKSVDLEKISILLTMSDFVSFWAGKNLQTMISLIFTWVVLNSVILYRVMKDRISYRKHYQEHHRQSKLAYWIARFFHDVVYYIPISLMALLMIATYDDHMVMAPKCIMLQPLATLPFLYLCSHLFSSEITGTITLFCYTLVVQLLIPYLLVASRLNSQTEVSGDSTYKLVKFLPFESVMSSLMFNSKMLEQLSLFRQNNSIGKGEDVETDENHPTNGTADVNWIIIHAIICWVVLILFVEWRVPFCNYSRLKQVTQKDNDEFFGELPLDSQELENDSERESMNLSELSEIAQIEGEGKNIHFQPSVKPKTDRSLAYRFIGLTFLKERKCCGMTCGRPTETIIGNLSAKIQAGSKFAIISEGAQGKTTVLNTLISRRSAFRVAGIIKKQQGRGTPVYTCSRDSDVLYGDLSLAQNLDFYVKLGSVHKLLVRQMVLSFGLKSRQHVLVKNLTASERQIIQLILALAGSNRTVILDEPFSGLTIEQNLKIVKIIRQKQDCTIIVTAKSKSEIELLQPNQIITCKSKESEIDLQSTEMPSSIGYLLALRLNHCPSTEGVLSQDDVSQQEQKQLQQPMNIDFNPPSQSDVSGLKAEQFSRFIQENFIVFNRLKDKKRRVVVQVVTKLMKKAQISADVAEEIAEMVHEDLQMQTSSEELALRCLLIRSLFDVVTALCKRFGEVHLEQRQDEYAVVRVVFNESCRPKIFDDSFMDDQRSPVFSSVVEFINRNQCIKTNTVSCHFLSAQHNLSTASITNQKGSSKKSQLGQSGSSSAGDKVVKIFRWSSKQNRIVRANPVKEYGYSANSQMLASLPTQSLVSR